MEELKLVPYRDFWAIERGKTLCYCPETNEPCSSACVFFYYTIDKKKKANVTLNCRTTQLLFVIGV